MAGQKIPQSVLSRGWKELPQDEKDKYLAQTIEINKARRIAKKEYELKRQAKADAYFTNKIQLQAKNLSFPSKKTKVEKTFVTPKKPKNVPMIFKDMTPKYSPKPRTNQVSIPMDIVWEPMESFFNDL